MAITYNLPFLMFLTLPECAGLAFQILDSEHDRSLCALTKGRGTISSTFKHRGSLLCVLVWQLSRHLGRNLAKERRAVLTAKQLADTLCKERGTNPKRCLSLCTPGLVPRVSCFLSPGHVGLDISRATRVDQDHTAFLLLSKC